MSRRLHRCAAHGWRPAAPDSPHRSAVALGRIPSPGRQRHVSHRKPTAAAPPPRGSGIGVACSAPRSRVKLQISLKRVLWRLLLSSRKVYHPSWSVMKSILSRARAVVASSPPSSARRAVPSRHLLRRGRPPPARAPREGRATGPTPACGPCSRMHTSSAIRGLPSLSLKGSQIRGGVRTLIKDVRGFVAHIQDVCFQSLTLSEGFRVLLPTR